MRKNKTVVIDDRRFQVQEARVRDVMDFMAEFGTENLTLQDLKKAADQFLPRLVDGLTADDLVNLYPSEIKMIWDGLAEVNSDFLLLAQRLGVDQALAGIKAMYWTTFGNPFSGWFDPGTSGSGTTAGGRS
jgi:hypothetical protein